MKYQLCPNISLEHVCGVHLLVACGDAMKSFDYVRVINDAGAEILAMADCGQDVEEIIREISILYDIKEKDIRPGILHFLDEMETNGYLLPISGGKKDEEISNRAACSGNDDSYCSLRYGQEAGNGQR